MWGWFGGAAAQKRKDAPKEAILGLHATLDLLQKREKHYETLMAEQDAIARKNVTTNKTAAKTALRRKKMHERNLEQTQAQVSQIEQQIYTIQAANINQETFNAMKNAGAAMKQIHGNLTIDKVDATMDELREQAALGEEIANAISSAPLGEAIDETELEDELENLEQEAIDAKMISTGTVPVTGDVNKLPAVSTGPMRGKPLQEEDDEEKELQRLQAEMAM